MLRGPGSVVGIATGYGLDGPGIESRWGRDFFAPVQTVPAPPPASCIMGTGSFPRVKSGRGVTLTPHHLLVPWSWKGRAVPLLPLLAVRPVQSLSAGTRVHFTFLLTVLQWATVGPSIKRLATGWTVQGSNPAESEIFRTRPDQSGGSPSLLRNGYRSFSAVKRPGRGVDHPTSSSTEVKE